jgi:hypothetical protein
VELSLARERCQGSSGVVVDEFVARARHSRLNVFPDDHESVVLCARWISHDDSVSG